MMLRLPRRGLAQIIALVVILLVDRAVSPQFFDLRLQDGRLFGSLVDVLNPRHRSLGRRGDGDRGRHRSEPCR